MMRSHLLNLDPIEIEETLQTMEILVDSREQDTDKARSRYAKFIVPHKRAVLDYGDYAANCILPDGSSLYDTTKRVCAECAVERKMSLDELAMCFTRGRERFQREFERAQAHNASIYLLVENATWEKLLDGRYRSKLNPNAFKASITAWMARYDAQIIMCRADTSGKLINEILYRELKELLTKGIKLNGKGEQDKNTEERPTSECGQCDPCITSGG